MRNRAAALMGAALLMLLAPAVSQAQLTAYSQDFEAMVQVDPGALSADGWVVYGNVFGPTRTPYLYGYGVYPAPNHVLAFSNIAVLEGGPDQGAQQLSIFSDYENADHGAGNIIESNVFIEQTIGAENVGEVWEFTFDAKKGNLIAPSTAAAFIKTIDPTNNWWMTNFVAADMTACPDTWGTYSVELYIVEDLVGQLLQFGFTNDATNYVSSGIFYDNLYFGQRIVGAPSASLAGVTMEQNYPNPFNPSTRIDFNLEAAGSVDIAVFDLAGRRVAVLESGEFPAGDHYVVWNGTNDAGALVASGRYSYVLSTAAGRISRSMVLLK